MTNTMSNSDTTTLYVDNIHEDVTETMLYDIFCLAGAVRPIWLCRITNSILGSAYVNFHHSDDAEVAMDAFNLFDIKGQPMRISRALPHHGENDVGKIFMRNLEESIDKESIKETLSSFGRILSCKVIPNGTGGTGFVQFEAPEAAERAIARLNGLLLNDQLVSIGRYKANMEQNIECSMESQDFGKLMEAQSVLFCVKTTRPIKKDTPPVVQQAVTEALSWEPTVHQRTECKIEDWSFHPKKSMIIMGDSNLARVPRFPSKYIQVDSYPGAQFFHLTEMLKKVPPTRSVRTVVLSAGLNNCLRHQSTESIIQQLRALLKTAKKTFPGAKVQIPIINYSEGLEMKQKKQLVNLNNFIESNCNFLSGLHPSNFWTQRRNPIHWTKRTADLIIHHWVDQISQQ